MRAAFRLISPFAEPLPSYPEVNLRIPAGVEASGEGTNVARCVLTLNFGPRIACAAVDPRQMMTRGLMTLISACSHGRHAVISAAFGFL